MAQSPRYRRTGRRRYEDPAPRDPEFEEEMEERARYGNFAIYMIVGLTIAVLAAIIVALIFIPEWS